MNDKQLGRYEILRTLGQGAMGVVCEARDPHLDRLVAIKTIRMAELSADQASAYERRFLTEARSAARLRHPAIVSVFDAGRDDDVTYLVMEKVDGINLKQCLNHGVQFSVAGAVRIVLDVLSGLEHAHSQKIIHRDIKPENILLDALGVVKLTDFGIAKMQDGADNGTQVSGLSIGTPRYMSPEQVRGNEVDARSDLFSAGVLLFELLTASLPFEGPNPMAVASKILHDAHPQASRLRPEVPAPIDAVLDVALAKLPSLRYATAAEFAQALVQACGEAVPLERHMAGTGGGRAEALVEPDSVGMLQWLLRPPQAAPEAQPASAAAGEATVAATRAPEPPAAAEPTAVLNDPNDLNDLNDLEVSLADGQPTLAPAGAAGAAAVPVPQGRGRGRAVALGLAGLVLVGVLALVLRGKGQGEEGSQVPAAAGVPAAEAPAAPAVPAEAATPAPGEEARAAALKVEPPKRAKAPPRPATEAVAPAQPAPAAPAPVVEAPAPQPKAVVAEKPAAARPPAEPCVGLGFLDRESCLWKACFTDTYRKHAVCQRFSPDKDAAAER
jgi:serine/threonine-protein kinase